MNKQPTLIILAEPTLNSAVGRDDPGPPSTGGQAMGLFSVMDSTVRRGLASGLPMIVVAPPDMARQARTLLPGNDVVDLPDLPSPSSCSRADRLARAVAAGVEASANAPGWLLLPADMPMLQVDTLRAVAHAVALYTVVFPQYRHRRGHPVGFSAELFSELIRLDNERDLARLTARYPAMGVDVDDPGVLMAHDAQSGLAQLRVQLHGTNLAPR
ncbi:nucleotidyltransferase family protein [Aquabacterium sp.]|uniref:nucleotidyltransferase family protein n=1 Tax=Aquabacterium sp. TaxID=1872578 RepID=UPI003D6CC5B0